MRIHEYQAKRLLKSYGIPVPRGAVAFSAAEAEAAARFLGGERWVIKAQIHAGGRGEAGGIAFANDLDEVKIAAERLLAKPLVTAETGPTGLRVKRLYVEEAVQPARELYLALYVDRSTGQVTFLGSRRGGVSITSGAVPRPEEIVKIGSDPDEPASGRAADELAARMTDDEAAVPQVGDVAKRLYRAFWELDASLIELNPLALLTNGRAVALDTRVILDDNALFRHPALEALRDDEDTPPEELEAARHEINYVAMAGTVGCVANGAGLGMATVDLLKLRGVEPANFMDIRPVATREQIATGFRMMLRNSSLTCILVNIFGGGIIRCDLVAEAMVLATREIPIRIPVVVRFAGTNAELGQKLLANSALPAEFARDLPDAVDRIERHYGKHPGGSTASRAVAAWV
ncbi:MAG TPA: ADP-forming succinate--CoA ligase subunit beta [Alphaproteobacteria bacterium]|nr:ADP-forming succinate--CoA ligase subunit beta [Alphaproteobacteria bacterium]